MLQERVRATLERLPPSPGCYLFKNRQGKILYVGKAKRLDQRVRSYFQSGRVPHPRTDRLVQLFPEQFWSETAIAVGIVAIVAALLTAWVAARRARSATPAAVLTTSRVRP